MSKEDAFGNWTFEWTLDADGSLPPVFGVDLGASDDIVYTVVIGYPREPADPMDRLVDGLTVGECLERYTAWQRRDDHPSRVGWCYRTGLELYPLTAAQKDAARLAWSAELKRKQQEAGETERRSICVDDDRWEP